MKKRFTLLRISVLVLALGLILVTTGQVEATARTWYVNPVGTDDGSHGAGNGTAAFKTIQYAVNAAAAAGGGTVHVAAATYKERIILRNGVNVLGAGADNTIIDGERLGTVVTVNSSVSDTMLDGFTITNGYSNNFGGGMFNDANSSPAVNNCTFTGNIGVFGGGMFNMLGSRPTVTNCTFATNAGFIGGGMVNIENASPAVVNCTFTGNSGILGGGMINLLGCSPVVTNCTFTGNSSLDMGDGLINMDDSALETINQVISADTLIPEAGGIYNYESSSPTVTNCIIWGNDMGIINSDTCAPAVTYCDVQGGYPGEGNINVNPLFVDTTESDYHLQHDSPCIDSGNNTAQFLPRTDFESNSRILDGNGDHIAIVDMGVDEFYIRPKGLGGEVAPVNKTDILIPWTGLILAFALAVYLGVQTAKRHRAK